MPDDVYTHGHAESVLRSHRWRTAENSAAYLLPHLDPSARVLDVGCGPGTITLDLARLVPYGAVTGMDRSAGVISAALEAAEEANLPNVEFAVGDVYALDYADASFDVVHAHQVLQHLSDPVAALREMRRVCRPGGIVAARDGDYAAFAWWPLVPELEDWLDLYRRVARSNEAEPDAGRRIKGWDSPMSYQLRACGATRAPRTSSGGRSCGPTGSRSPPSRTRRRPAALRPRLTSTDSPSAGVSGRQRMRRGSSHHTARFFAVPECLADPLRLEALHDSEGLGVTTSVV